MRPKPDEERLRQPKPDEERLRRVGVSINGGEGALPPQKGGLPPVYISGNSFGNIEVFKSFDFRRNSGK